MKRPWPSSPELKNDLRFQTVFFRSLATMFAAGVPLVAAFEQLEAQAESVQAKRVAADIAHRVRTGETLPRAMAAQTGTFSVQQLRLIQVGCQSGALERVLMQLADYEEKRRALLMLLSSKLTYPLIVFSLSMVALVFLPTLVLEDLLTVLIDSGQPLPPLTQLLILWARVLGSFWFYLFFGGRRTRTGADRPQTLANS